MELISLATIPFILLYFTIGTIMLILLTVADFVCKLFKDDLSPNSTEYSSEAEIEIYSLLSASIIILMIFGRLNFIYFQETLTFCLYTMGFCVLIRQIFNKKFYSTSIIVAIGLYFSTQYIAAIIFLIVSLVQIIIKSHKKKFTIPKLVKMICCKLKKNKENNII